MEKEMIITKENLLDPSYIPKILNETEDKNRNEIISQLVLLATQYKIKTTVMNSIRLWKQDKQFSSNNVAKLLKYNEDGNVEQSANNYKIVFDNDERYKNLFGYDSFSNKVVKFTKSGYKTWSDTDDSSLRVDIETDYGLYNQQKYYDAFNKTVEERSFNPIHEIIENKPWDNIPRIDRFLVDIMKCDDNNYSREVSRMIFYGGISRLYRPGCKFDYMPIFIGEQGTYKSTIVNWLAIHDDYFGDINTIEGKDALDNIQGRWICEFSELLALVRTKDVEAMKSFITKSIDKYRASYERRTQEYPRKCIFIGTTNDVQFLSDKTGNRRYLPIQIKLKPGELKDKETEVKEYILNCWREAYYLFKNGKTYLTIPSEYYQDVLDAQNSAIEDDPKMGMLLDYLNEKPNGGKVCTIEIFTNCFNEIKKKFTRQDAKEISRMLSSLPNWKRSNSTYRFETFGTQKYWEKIDVNKPTQENKPVVKEQKWSDLD